ncbi:MAG: flagellar protein FlaG [Spirochaetes bacterium]|nr:flagellar protein FlaG [Spirochaetota bacterium]
MDITTILSNTINNLNTHYSNGTHPVAEIEINEPIIEKGGREAAPEEIKRALDAFNKAASIVDGRVEFFYHKETKRIIMRMTDPVTHEVVKQFPSKDMISLLTNINERLGLFVDEKR